MEKHCHAIKFINFLLLKCIFLFNCKRTWYIICEELASEIVVLHCMNLKSIQALPRYNILLQPLLSSKNGNVSFNFREVPQLDPIEVRLVGGDKTASTRPQYSRHSVLSAKCPSRS